MNYDDTITRASAALLAQRTMNRIQEGGFISKPISTIFSEQKVNLLKVKSITVQVQITEHFLQKKCYNADVIIESISGDINKKVKKEKYSENARNFATKRIRNIFRYGNTVLS